MFQQGQWVMYGVHGVCKVIGTEKQLVNRKRTEYLVLEAQGQGVSRYYLPVGNEMAMAKLRPVMTREALEALMISSEIREDAWIPDENARKQHYRDLIGSCDRKELLKMVRSLYRYRAAQFAAGKKFHLCDDYFLRDAEKLLCSEICLVTGRTPDAARTWLREQLSE